MKNYISFRMKEAFVILRIEKIRKCVNDILHLSLHHFLRIMSFKLIYTRGELSNFFFNFNFLTNIPQILVVLPQKISCLGMCALILGI